MDLTAGNSPTTAPGGAAGDLIRESSTASFTKDVIEASRTVPVLVDFWAPWCQPCKQLTPVLEKVVKSYGGRVRLVKINTDEHPAIAGQLRIQSLPTVYAFVDGRPLDGFMGVQPEGTIREFIDRLAGGDTAADLENALASAQEALDADDLQSAAEIYAAILREDKQNASALAGLARCYLKSGDIERAEQTIALVPPAEQESAAVSAVNAALALARKAGDTGDIDELSKKVAADPKDHQVRFDLAVALAANNRKADAVDELLQIIRADRTWNEDAARKQLVEFFDAWGPTDDATLDGRRRLSSILFS